MPAELSIFKYTGKCAEFGTPVSSIGLKRVDSAVPAVYGNPILPGDDKSDVLRYSVLVPTDNSKVYSFESIFKIHLKTPPTNQLSNIRIYPEWPEGVDPLNPNAPIFKIGVSQSFSRPTNIQSTVATNLVSSYTQANPFQITIGGLSGYEISPEVFGIYTFQVTTGDTGSGNKFYINGEKQQPLRIIIGNDYTFVNNVTGTYVLNIYDTTDTLVSDPDVEYGTSGPLDIITIHATQDLFNAFPNGFKYGSSTDPNMGGFVEWFDIDDIGTETIEYTVEVAAHNNKYYFYLNGTRAPALDFREGKIYKFTNPHGNTNPFRLVTQGKGGVEDFVIIDGITVENGGTINEIVTVDTTLMLAAGKVPSSYQSTTNESYGNIIRFVPLDSVGAYNMNTVGGGTSDPSAAGETDYIYLQIEVNKDTNPELFIPNLRIEYDES